MAIDWRTLFSRLSAPTPRGHRNLPERFDFGRRYYDVSGGLAQDLFNVGYFYDVCVARWRAFPEVTAFLASSAPSPYVANFTAFDNVLREVLLASGKPDPGVFPFELTRKAYTGLRSRCTEAIEAAMVAGAPTEVVKARAALAAFYFGPIEPDVTDEAYCVNEVLIRMNAYLGLG